MQELKFGGRTRCKVKKGKYYQKGDCPQKYVSHIWLELCPQSRLVETYPCQNEGALVF